MEIKGTLIAAGEISTLGRGITLDVCGEDVELVGMSAEEVLKLKNIIGERLIIRIARESDVSYGELLGAFKNLVRSQHAGNITTEMLTHWMLAKALLDRIEYKKQRISLKKITQLELDHGD